MAVDREYGKGGELGLTGRSRSPANELSRISGS